MSGAPAHLENSLVALRTPALLDYEKLRITCAPRDKISYRFNPEFEGTT